MRTTSSLFQDPDNYLMLSGIQHFAFCRRQWAFIHIEQQWEDNVLTFGGTIIHRNADDPYFTECRGDVIISRSVPLVSHRLQIYGIADVVEYHRDEVEGTAITGRSGRWRPVPVEYKVGQKKPDDRDEVQVCAQALCLEEMYQIRIMSGFLYYGKIRRRCEVVFDSRLRCRVEKLVSEMYTLFDDGITPAAEPGKHCTSCSLINLCVPQIFSRKRSIKQYFTDNSER